MCFLKFSSYRKKKIIADHSLITPKCPFKTCQKTILQLLFKSSFFSLLQCVLLLYFSEQYPGSFKRKSIDALKFAFYSSFLSFSTWYGETHYDNSHAPFKNTLWWKVREICGEFGFTLKNHLWDLPDCYYLSQTWCSLRNPNGSWFIDWRPNILEDS